MVAACCSLLQSVLFNYTNASPKKSAKLNGRNTWLQLVAKAPADLLRQPLVVIVTVVRGCAAIDLVRE